MSESVARIIKSKMEDAGYNSDGIHTAPMASSSDGIVVEMVLADKFGRRFNVTVYQTDYADETETDNTTRRTKV